MAAALNVLFSVLVVRGSLFTAVVPKYGFGFWPVWGPRVAVYVSFWHVELLFAFWQLVKEMRFAGGAKREQVKYMIAAFSIGYLGGGLVWVMWSRVYFPPYSIILVSVYSAIVAYAILRHHLMDINVVIRKTLLYSLVSVVLASVYVGTITLAAHVVGERHGSAGAFSSALAAIFITVLFNPLRVKVQHFVDRYFFRESLDQAILREATSGFVHEIKRPLANISLPAELGLMDLQDVKEKRRSFKDVLPKLEQRLQYILDQTRDAGNKIEAIREYSVSNGKPTEPVDIAAILRQSVSAHEALLRRHEVTISLNISADLPAIQGHAKQLEIVFSNLIKNAAEAMAQTGQATRRLLEVTAEAAQEKILIRMKDSGPGIKRENLPRLFEPYFTTKGAHGMGMGLFLCRQFVNAHGGTIEVLSESGRGVECVVSLSISGSS